MRVRVLVADESVVTRRFLREVVDPEPTLEFVGVAAHHEVVNSKIALCDPDVVLIEVEMAVQHCGAALAAIQRAHPTLPILVYSHATERGAHSTLDALALGAADFVRAPSAHVAREEAIVRVRDELAAKIRAVCPKSAIRATAEFEAIPFEPRSALPTPHELSASRIDCIVMTAKSGGPNALAKIVSTFREPLPVPIVVAQHMPPVFTHVLAERLNQRSNIRVVEAEHGMDLEAGTAYVLPGGRPGFVRARGPRREIVLEGPVETRAIPLPLDPLLASVGDTFGAHVLTVVLTGEGTDGWRGCAELRNRGALVWAQDERSCAAFGLARAVARAGLPERILALADLGSEIERRVAGPLRSLPAMPAPERNDRFERFRTYRLV